MHIAPLSTDDRAPWELLARGYKEFYKTPTSDEEFETAWNRLLGRDGILGLGAKVDGRLVGIAHYLFHTTTWAPKICYLQDLFTAQDVRGQGVGRALIEAVYERAKTAGAGRVYWHTHETNTVARRLYDKVADLSGFIVYRKQP